MHLLKITIGAAWYIMKLDIVDGIVNMTKRYTAEVCGAIALFQFTFCLKVIYMMEKAHIYSRLILIQL